MKNTGYSCHVPSNLKSDAKQPVAREETVNESVLHGMLQEKRENRLDPDGKPWWTGWTESLYRRSKFKEIPPVSLSPWPHGWCFTNPLVRGRKKSDNVHQFPGAPLSAVKSLGIQTSSVDMVMGQNPVPLVNINLNGCSSTHIWYYRFWPMAQPFSAKSLIWFAANKTMTSAMEKVPRCSTESLEIGACQTWKKLCLGPVWKSLSNNPWVIHDHIPIQL